MRTDGAPAVRSTAPTAFAGYSFHVAEAVLVFANEIMVVFLFPIHASLHRIYHVATTAIHIGAHQATTARFLPIWLKHRTCLCFHDAHGFGPGPGSDSDQCRTLQLLYLDVMHTAWLADSAKLERPPRRSALLG